MLHASGEWAVQRDGMLAAVNRTMSRGGTRRLRGRPRIVASSLHAPFEKWRSLLWHDTCVAPADWEEFVEHISHIPKVQDMFVRRSKERRMG
eukprot:3436040-Pyramimonas_sp.AAC.1